MNTRKFIVDNQEFYFNYNSFKDICRTFIQNKKITFTKLEEDLANKTNKSTDAIHNWRNRKNGPSDIETIKLIAEYFELSNYKILLIENKLNMKNNLTENQITAAKKIYDRIIEFLDLFLKTNGFNDIWFEMSIEPKCRESELYDIAEKEINKIILQLQKEFFYLKNTELYFELENYIENDLYNTFDKKLSYGYRYEAIGDNPTHPTTFEDYTVAINKINNIIEKYIK